MVASLHGGATHITTCGDRNSVGSNIPGSVAEFFYSVSLHHDHLRGHCVAFGESGIFFRGVCHHGNHRAFACIWAVNTTFNCSAGRARGVVRRGANVGAGIHSASNQRFVYRRGAHRASALASFY